MFIRFPLCLLCKPVSQDREQRDPEVSLQKLLALGAATGGGEGGGEASQVNDIKPFVCPPRCLILSPWFVALTLAWKRRKSLNGKGLYWNKVVTNKERMPPPPLFHCYCLHVSRLITPLDQVSWLTMGKRRDLPESVDTHQPQARTHTLKHTHNKEIETKGKPPVAWRMLHVSRPLHLQ